MKIPAENWFNAAAALVGFSLLPVTFVWCGGNLSDLPAWSLLLMFPMGFAGAGIANAWQNRY